MHRPDHGEAAVSSTICGMPTIVNSTAFGHEVLHRRERCATGRIISPTRRSALAGSLPVQPVVVAAGERQHDEQRRARRSVPSTPRSNVFGAVLLLHEQVARAPAR